MPTKVPEDRKDPAPTSYTIDTGTEKVALSLRLKFRHIRRLVRMSNVDELAAIDYLMEECIPSDVVEVLDDLDDDVAFPQLLGYLTALGDRLGATLGESVGSTDSSTDTVEP